MIVRAQIQVDIRRQFRFWIAIVLAGVLKVIPWPMSFLQDIATVASVFAYWVGIPLLAAMPFAWEFQYGTMSSLMSQPVARKTVWTGKTLVSVVSVTSVGFLYSLIWNPTITIAFVAIGWSVLALGGSALLVLQTRSSSGGQVTNVLHAMLAMMGWAAVWTWLSGFDKDPTVGQLRILLAGWSASVALHSLAMLWLGRRKWLRFQATAGVAGTTSSSTNPPELLRPILSGILGSTPSSPWLNLVRKEVVLLWPVWMLALGIVVLQLLFAVAASFAATFLSDVLGAWREMAALIVAISVGFLAVLSGTLSVADERLTGTQSWHMTLPISARRQWAIKLAAAIVPVPLCAAVLAATFVTLFGIPRGLPELFDPLGLLPVLFLLPLVAFWCSTAAREALQTVGWLIALSIALLFAAAAGFWLGGIPIWYSSFLSGIVSTILALPMKYLLAARLAGSLSDPFIPLLLVVPALAALFQSHSLYRTQPFGRIGPAVRRLLVLAVLVGAVCCTSAVSSEFVNKRVDALRKDALIEIVRAVAVFKPNVNLLTMSNIPSFRVGKVFTIPMEELSRSYPVSSSTSALVGQNAPRIFGMLNLIKGGFTTEVVQYHVALNFVDGAECDVYFPVEGSSARPAHFYCHEKYYRRQFSGKFPL